MSQHFNRHQRGASVVRMEDLRGGSKNEGATNVGIYLSKKAKAQKKVLVKPSAQAQVDLIAATPIVESFGRMEPRQNSHISIAIPDDDRIGDDSIIGEISDAKINPVEESGQEWVGGRGLSGEASRLFLGFVQENDLVDIGYWGSPFTLSCGSLHQRLDRFLVNTTWLDQFSEACVQNLDRLGSDYRPIFLRLCDKVTNGVDRPFHFISAWQDHSQFCEFLKLVWKKNNGLFSNLSSLQSQIKNWNKMIFGYIGQRKKKLQARIMGIDRAMFHWNSNNLSELVNQLRDELDDVLAQEESFWRKKSCAKWIVDGDRNTKYYHASIKARR
ncbi:hypothetical protein V6N13_126494 [Hibiscus sabdariffa]